MKPINHHCCVVVIDGFGIMIEGASGSGKSSLAMGLVERAQVLGLSAILVGDDQVYLERQNDVLIASVPKALQGKIELRGFGIIDRSFQQSARIDLIAKLVPDDDIERMPDAETASRLDIELPAIKLPIRHETASVRIIIAMLSKLRANISCA
jgi:serine kinase of HPr protein (carbohydrate metabolism regulator)